jgi:hypothetical protein
MGKYEGILSDFIQRGLIPPKVRRDATDKIRSYLARALLRAVDGIFWVPAVLPAAKGRADVVISPDEYLERVSSPRYIKDKGGGGRIIVDGDVVIGLSHAPTLPTAVIKGKLELCGCPELKKINFTVIGGARIEDCPALEYLEGEYFSDLNCARLGVSRLGADVHVHRNLLIKECASLLSVNCVVDGRFLAKDCWKLENSGPGFCTGRVASFESCPSLKQLQGAVGGLSLGAGIKECDVERGRLVVKNKPIVNRRMVELNSPSTCKDPRRGGR